MKLVRYTGSNDWSALYVDGNLETVGDHNLIDERIAELCSIEVRDGEDFLMGSRRSKDTAATLDEIEAWIYEDKKHAIWCRGHHEGQCKRGITTGTEKLPAALREEAAALLERAQELDNQY
jgi:hypothetical protein